jgi:hypothetical protein
MNAAELARKLAVPTNRINGILSPQMAWMILEIEPGFL